MSATQEQVTRDFLRLANAEHAATRTGDDALRVRMEAYEFAARMQLAAPEASDLARETRQAHALYGTDDANPLNAAYARNCLLARQFPEKGVRYVSLYCASRASAINGLLNWDAHKTLKADYERHCPVFDQPTSALLTDLKQRGLLADTLVLWCTEFGRMPTHQEGASGRDHNSDAFTTWMCGVGIKGGISHGATDDCTARAWGDANGHRNQNWPILLAGGGFNHGQHLAFQHDSQ